MADTTISPNMGLPVPTVGVDPGPDWANNLNASLSIIDQHNHSSGQGVQINPNGININADLPFNGNNGTTFRSVRFSPQASPISGTADLGCLYESGVDLYYNDGGGNQIRITQSGSVAGASGTITGLPSGTASASYSAGTFTFQSATNTPATMAIGPIVLGQEVANSKTITIAPNSGIANNYNFFLPAALPGAVNYTTLDNSGNFSYNSAGSTGSGAVVLATSPTITTPTLAFTTNLTTFNDGTYTPTFNVTSGSATVALTSGVACRFQQINNFVTVWMSVTLSGASTPTITITLPVAPANNFSNANQLFGFAENSTSTITITASNSSKLAIFTGSAFSSQIITMSFSYYINN